MTDEWKSKAAHCFFQEHMSIQDICREIGKTRKHVSNHLQTLPGYMEEKQSRKAANQEKRKEDKREWDRSARKPRAVNNGDDAAMLKNDHIQAVRELSHEKYH